MLFNELHSDYVNTISMLTYNEAVNFLLETCT